MGRGRTRIKQIYTDLQTQKIEKMNRLYQLSTINYQLFEKY